MAQLMTCHTHNCRKAVEYVADYADGVGACRFHLKRLLDWIFEDKPSVRVYSRLMWLEKQRREK